MLPLNETQISQVLTIKQHKIQHETFCAGSCRPVTKPNKVQRQINEVLQLRLPS